MLDLETAFLNAITSESTDHASRLVFADWLEERGDPRAEWVRDQYAFTWMGPKADQLTSALIRVLSSPQHTEQQKERARQVLVGMGESAVPALIAGFSRDVGARPEDSVTLPCLREIGVPALPLLRHALHSDDPSTRLGAIQALGAIGAIAATALPDLLACRGEIGILFDSWCETWGEQVVEHLEDWSIHTLACIGVTSLGEEQIPVAVEYLLRGFDSRFRRVEAATEALKSLGPAITGRILDLVPDYDIDTYQNIGEILAGFGLNNVPILLQRLCDSGQGPRPQIVCAIALRLLAAQNQLGPYRETIRNALAGLVEDAAIGWHATLALQTINLR